MRRFAKSTCPVRTHHVSFVLNHLEFAHLHGITLFADYVHQLCTKESRRLAQAARGRNWHDDKTSMPALHREKLPPETFVGSNQASATRNYSAHRFRRPELTDVRRNISMSRAEDAVRCKR